MESNYQSLPDDLPRPADDGGARHLPGMALPAMALRATSGTMVDIGTLAPGAGRRAVLYIYPMSGVPGVPLPEGWNEIPGARGCTPQALAFRDHKAEIAAAGADLYGLSTQSPDEQLEFAERLHLPYAILSDSGLRLTTALGLPTFTVEGRTLLKRLTLIIRDNRIEHLFYPVFPSTSAAPTTLAWLRQHPI